MMLGVPPRRRPRRAHPQTSRCRYVAGTGERCRRIATIDGTLCRGCAELIAVELEGESLIDGVISGKVPLGDAISSAMGGFVERMFAQSPFLRGMASAARPQRPGAPQASSPPPRSESRSAPRPPPPPDPERHKKQQAILARSILGFEPLETLTIDQISDRRKQLAKVYHPDRPGGSLLQMQRVNQAADVLLAQLAKRA